MEENKTREEDWRTQGCFSAHRPQLDSFSFNFYSHFSECLSVLFLKNKWFLNFCDDFWSQYNASNFQNRYRYHVAFLNCTKWTALESHLRLYSLSMNYCYKMITVSLVIFWILNHQKSNLKHQNLSCIYYMHWDSCKLRFCVLAWFCCHVSTSGRATIL